MAKNIAKGRMGEAAALEFLKAKGHDILHSNFRWDRKEIDLISVDNKILVFTEVKTRTSFDFGFPEEAIDERKKQHIKVVAEEFILNNPQYKEMRFDIISVLLNNLTVKEIRHFESAFY